MLRVLAAIEQTASIKSDLWIVALTDNKPNAAATKDKNGSNVVLITTTMMDRLGDDADAYAFLFGHEIAHHVLGHGASNQTRQAVLQGLSILASLIIGYRTGVNVGGLTDLGANLIDRSFSRDQERDADQTGLKYMSTAGFDLAGAIRLQRVLLTGPGSSTLPFFSTHPSGEERIANLEREIQSIGVKTTEHRQQAVVSPEVATPDDLWKLMTAVRMVRENYSGAFDESELATSCMRRVSARLGKQYDGGATQLDQVEKGLEVMRGLDPKVYAATRLTEECIRGLLQALDQSTYLDRDDFLQLKSGSIATSTPAGIGVELRLERGFPVIVSTIDGSPARRSGLLPGDVIGSVDSVSMMNTELQDVIKLLRGAAGSTVGLTIYRPDAEQPLEFAITRAIIRVQSVRSKTIDAGYVYVRISQFQRSTVDSFALHIHNLYRTNTEGVRGIVIDVRNNPGGLLYSCVDIASTLLPADVLVVDTIGRTKNASRRYTAATAPYSGREARIHLERLPPDLKTVPIVVIVNKGTAACAEIFASALQDHGRATIVGEPTFGMGIGKTVVPFKDDTALQLVTSTFQRPSGKPITKLGVTPDITMPTSAPPDDVTTDLDAPLQAALRAIRTRTSRP